ncbi:MAG: DUF5689 domain-containing protein [Prevotella sp.]|nr:DUF5689 domain-containing protein [Prevotella sp.]
MKKMKYILIACVCALMTGCMAGEDYGFDTDWSAPDTDNAYGNPELQETNVITVKELLSRYVDPMTAANDTTMIREDVQIKVIVTGNDIEGNIYNEVAVKDETGAILICIAQGGLYGYLPVGKEILVDLKGLHIGLYGNQPQIGVAYTNASGKTFPSRMNRNIWQKHFKYVDAGFTHEVAPEEFDVTRMQDVEYVKACRGKLMTVKGVTMAEADGVKVWASDAEKDAGNGVSRSIAVDGKVPMSGRYASFVVRSSTYADFAAQVMPKEKVYLTGIFTVYANNPKNYGYTWQILLREGTDIEIAE